MADADQFDSRADVKSPDDQYKRWRAEISEALGKEKGWREKSKRVIKRFRDERDTQDNRSRFNILYSNVISAKAAIYQQPPRPDVRRRFGDKDPVGKAVAEVIERGLGYCIDDYDFDEHVMACVDDYLLTGRGVIRVRYRADVETIEPEGDGDEPESYEQIRFQDAKSEYVHWTDFLTSPARRWEDVRWVAFRHLMAREEIAKLNKEAAKEVGLTYSVSEDESGDTDELFRRAEVWEIWDSESRKVIWVSPGYDALLYEQDDPLGLVGFFPAPEPLYGIRTTDTLIPVPEFALYQDLATELDDITQRIAKLTDMLKVRGVYDAGCENLADILTLDDGELRPAENAAALAERGGLESAIWLMPLDKIAATLRQLYESRDQVKQIIYEVMGISDLIRGASDPTETASAQRIKAQFGTMRLDAKKRAVARFARDVLRLKAELLCEHFEPEVLTRMTGVEVTPDMIAVMRDDALRAYRIDIETDSTIAPDEQAEQEAAVKLMTAFSQMLEVVAPLVKEGTISQENALELVRIGVTPFKGARHLLNVLDEAEGEGQGQEQPPQPTPEQQVAQSEMQIEQAKGQVQMQKHQFEMLEAEVEHENKMLELQIARLKLEEERMQIAAGAAMSPPPRSSPPPQAGAGRAS